MSKQTEAMKLALEALQTAHLAVECDMLADEIQQAITALKKLVEQPAIKQDLTPEQNQCKFPLCQSDEYQQALAEQIKRELYTGEPAQQEPVACANGCRGFAKYPAQRTWVGLTEQEAAECWSTSTVRTWQAIEAKLKEKNT